MSYATARKRGANSEVNKLYPEDRAIHEWYRFVLSFPPHLVREYLQRWGLNASHQVLDPFCGTGTVLVECKKQGIASVGIEANAMAHLASRVKADWSPDPDDLIAHATHVAQIAARQLEADGIEDMPIFEAMQSERADLRTLPPEQEVLLLTDSISPLPLHKALVLLECLEQHRNPVYYRHEQLALAKALVFSSSNLRFGPEVGVGQPKHDAPVIAPWLANVHGMANDLRDFRHQDAISAVALRGDSREMLRHLAPNSIDAVFTSPPYPNEKDYTRTTRLESVLLGLLRNKSDLRSLKQTLLRSNTRNIYKCDDDEFEILHPQVQRIADEIEARRIQLGKTSGFERLYATVTRHYFGGMARHLAELRPSLRSGAHLAYVVGDQASYLQVMIPTGQLLAEIGVALGYRLVGIDLFRTRLATATKAQLREEVVVFRWPGSEEELTSRYLSLPLGVGVTRGQPMAEPSDGQRANRYQQIMERIFFSRYQPGEREVAFDRDELASTARELGIDVPLNLGDIPYSFRYRQELPKAILDTAGEGSEWVIQSVGRSKYKFVLRERIDLSPMRGLMKTKVPDATPGIVTMYAQDDEQGLLAKVRYNRLIDIFMGVTCYSLQNHLRTTVPNIGQIETDELYVGVDKRGAHFVFPVQAKGGRDKVGIVQIEQDFALCEERFSSLICRPITAQFMADGVIALKAFVKQDDLVSVMAERHYKLVPPEQMSDSDLQTYRASLEE